MRKTYDIEAALQALSSLVDRAQGGGTTIITRHGRPVAAVAPLNRVQIHGIVGVMALGGSGAGLWLGEAAVSPQRDAWG
ncbi:MAG: type II toxin-antitoxin system Phd/YefM family antitoxin [Planctomycetes bacterium]|nr:type II toxin-antitoxin system Phd/YefM family antitoxin [Planctomycetota bacterium]